MRAVQVNPRILSTAKDLNGHDVTYESTQYQRFGPTTPIEQWSQGRTLSWALPASSLDHDVPLMSCFDIIHRPFLAVPKSQIRTFYTDPNKTNLDFVGRVGASQVTQAVYHNIADGTTAGRRNFGGNVNMKGKDQKIAIATPFPGFEATDAALPSVSTGEIPAFYTQTSEYYKLPLPACSGFVPSQSYFHDLFSRLTVNFRNASEVQTIQAPSQGGFQYASKVLELLDSIHPRYGTAKIAEAVNGTTFGTSYGVDVQGSAFYVDASILNLTAGAPTTKLRQGESTGAFGYTGITGGSALPTALDGTLVTDAPRTAYNHDQANFIDVLSRGLLNASSRVAIRHKRPISYNVMTENDEWLHLSLTVGRENPDVYNISNLAKVIPSEDNLYSAKDLMGVGGLTAFSSPDETVQIFSGSFSGPNTPAQASAWAQYAASCYGANQEPMDFQEVQYIHWLCRNNTLTQQNPVGDNRVFRDGRDVPYLFTLHTLMGSQLDMVPGSKECALYRNRQIVQNINYYNSVVWDGTATDEAGVTPVATSPYVYNRDNYLFGSQMVKEAENPVYYRNLYRPKDGFFGIPYDIPAYSDKQINLTLGNYAQAYVGSACHDFNTVVDLMFGDAVRPLPADRCGPKTVAFSGTADAGPPATIDVTDVETTQNYGAFIRNYYWANQRTDSGITECRPLTGTEQDFGPSKDRILPWLRHWSPMWNPDLANRNTCYYGLEIARMDYLAYRHRVSTETEATVRQLIMENGLARYAVRRCEVQIRPIVAASLFDGTLYESTAADLIIVACIRNLALNYEKATATAQLREWMNKETGHTDPKTGYKITKWANQRIVEGLIGRFADGKMVDSFASAPARYQREGIPADFNPFGEPGLEMDEIYLRVNGLDEPQLRYNPDGTGGMVQYGNDYIYNQVMNELAGAGYPEVSSVLPRSVWESNVRLFAFNLTPSKFPIKGQGSNLPAKKNIQLYSKFKSIAPANRYSFISLAITQQTELEMDASGNWNWVY